MTNKIRRITEAFSMQPRGHSVTTKDAFDRCVTPAIKAELVEKILLETVNLGYQYGDPIEDLFYVGYSFTGERLFQYVATAVNVEYQVEALGKSEDTN